ncbi:hypothetical protein AO501_24965 [Mycobacterium gordonae]|uniref:Uncharacterized protein n=1 Tax=Mycobacterium gordonae TaxID=1778 RepID=A0A0Q2RJE5_MYCGO|nr:hypothetical protein AO501_24965 [Mycobacterium gordonae]
MIQLAIGPGHAPIRAVEYGSESRTVIQDRSYSGILVKATRPIAWLPVWASLGQQNAHRACCRVG